MILTASMDSDVLVAFRYDLDGGVFSVNAQRNISFVELRYLWSKHSHLDEEDHRFFTLDGKELPTSGCIDSVLPVNQFCLSVNIKIKELVEARADISSDLGSSAPDIAFEATTAPPQPPNSSSWLEECLTCSIHLDLFEDPRCLPCGHVYCCACLEQLITSNKKRCPLCRAQLQIPNSKPSELPAIFVISDLVKNISDNARTEETLDDCPDFSLPLDTPVSKFEPYDINSATRLPSIAVPRDLGTFVSSEALIQRLEGVFQKKVFGVWIHVATSLEPSSLDQTVILVRDDGGHTFFTDRVGRRVTNCKGDRNPRLRRTSPPVFVPENLSAVIDVDIA